MRTLILFFFCFGVSYIKAQNYVPLLSNLNEWHLTSCYNGCITDIYYINGDTTSNGLNYKVIDGYHYIERTFWLRESITEKKVYLSFANSDKNRAEKLLYDFSLQVNDSIKMYNPISPFEEDGGFYSLDSIVSRVLTDGNPYNHFYFSPSASNTISFEKPIWIEGLGTLSMINAPGGGPNVNGAGKVSCYFKDDILVYSQADSIQGCSAVNYLSTSVLSETPDFTVYPNPTSDVVKVKSEKIINKLSLRSLDGRHIKTVRHNEINTSELQAGNYLLEIDFEGGNRVIRIISKQ